MVFVIQTTQNRESEAVHLKLDELIRAVRGARNEFTTVEHVTEEELARREREIYPWSRSGSVTRNLRPG